MELSVEILEKIDRESLLKLEGFFYQDGRRSISLHPGWAQVIANSFNHRPYLIKATSGDEIVGYLTLQHVKSLLFGSYLVSQPYLNYGGPVTQNPKVSEALVQKALTLSHALGVKYLELRCSEKPIDGMQTHTLGRVNATLKLAASSDKMWTALSCKIRNQIRKAEKMDLAVEWGRENLLDHFYDVFSLNMRDLGTPVFAKKLFSEILAFFKDHSELCVVRFEKNIVAAGIVVHGQQTSEILSASSLRAFNYTNANMLLYWHLLQRSIDRHQLYFDFGRCSVGDGCYRFKKSWQAEFQNADWQFSVGGVEPGSLRRQNPKYVALTSLWKRLPLPLSNSLGPMIVRGIP